MEWIFWAFLCIFLYKLLNSLIGLLKTRYYARLYERYLLKSDIDFREHTQSVEKLFKGAGLPDSTIPVCQPVGWGQIMTGETSLFYNLANQRSDIVGLVLQNFSIARGSYRSKILECFSPLYWINFVIFLPSKLIRYIGFSPDGVFSKILQVIYWFATPLLIYFRSNIYNFVSQLIG